MIKFGQSNRVLFGGWTPPPPKGNHNSKHGRYC